MSEGAAAANAGAAGGQGAAGAGQTDLLSGGGAGGGQATSWVDSLPEDLRAEPSIKLHKDVGSMARSYLNAQKMVGADKIPVPGQNASDQDWQQVFRKLGVPESVDKYELKAPEGSNPEIISEFKKVAHAAGVLPKQAEQMVGFYQQINQKQQEANQTQTRAKMEEGVNSLRKEWGQAFDKELDVAKSALKQFGGDETLDYLRKNGLNNDPVIIKLLNKVGKSLSEDKFQGGGSGGGASTPKEAQAKITAMQSDPKGAYLNGDHPNHKAAVAEMQELYKQAFPG